MATALILRGLTDGYQGYRQGVAEEKATQLQDAKDELAKQSIAAQQELLPGQTATAKLKQDNDQARLKAANEMMPDQVTLAKADLQRQLDADAYKTVESVVNGQATADAAQTKLNTMMGQAIESGDNEALTRLVGHAIAAPIIFPGLKSLGQPKAAAVVDTPPEGVQGANGQPIVGKAIQLTMEDGTQAYLRADIPAISWQKAKAAQEAAGAKVMKEGETLVSPTTGKVIAAGQPKVDPRLELDRIHQERGVGVYAPGAGTGTGKGKAAGTPEQQALATLEETLKGNGKDTGGTQALQAKSRLSSVFASNPNINPQTAALVAYDSVMDPTKTSLQINPQTGQISGMYINPEIDGGKPFVVAEGSGTPEALEKQMGGKKGAAKAVGQMMASQDPVARDLITQYAAGGEAAAAVEQRLAGLPEAQRVQVLQSLQRKASLVKAYGAPAAAPAPAASAPAAAAPAAERRMPTVGGLLNGGYTPPPDSPAGRAAAAREQSASKALAERRAKEAAQAEAQRTASSQFQNEVAAATTPEQRLNVVRKWDGLRRSLPQADLITLNQLESKI